MVARLSLHVKHVLTNLTVRVFSDVVAKAFTWLEVCRRQLDSSVYILKKINSVAHTLKK